MNRLLIFVVFNNEKKLEKRTVYTLDSLKKFYETIVIVSNSKLSKKSYNKLLIYADKIILRENKGYDFGAWRDGIEHIGYENLESYSQLTIMNDTCYFPIYDFGLILSKMEKNKNLDFWGASIHKATPSGMPGTDGPVPEHIQSYFIVFGRKILKSKAFKEFWSNVKNFDNVVDVIQNYETQMTRKFYAAGFNYDAIFNPKDLHEYGKDIIDPLYQVPEKLLNENFPFLKTKVITKEMLQIVKKGLKENKSQYPSRIIKIHGIHGHHSRIKTILGL